MLESAVLDPAKHRAPYFYQREERLVRVVRNLID